MKVVVDLGCLERNGANSLATLADEYKPDRIYGFDPTLLVPGKAKVHGVPVILSQKAAWTHDGTVLFHEDGTASRIGAYGSEVECFDFSAWLKKLKADEIIVKMDIEGAEVALIERMIEDGTDALLSELLVEWHGAGEHLEEQLHCPVRRWWM